MVKRIKYTAEFKAEALKLAKVTGVAQAARQLNIQDAQIYQWRKAADRLANTSERESQLSSELAKLKRQLAEQREELAILKKAATYFAKNQR